MTVSEHIKMERLASLKLRIDRGRDPDRKPEFDREFAKLNDTGKRLVEMAASLLETGGYRIESNDQEVLDRFEALGRHLGANVTRTVRVAERTHELVFSRQPRRGP